MGVRQKFVWTAMVIAGLATLMAVRHTLAGSR
jgi:heme exporter protein D